MKWRTKVVEIIRQVLNNLDCNSSVNNEVLQIEQLPNEMNITLRKCLSCGHANTYIETIIGGYKRDRPYVNPSCSSCGDFLECNENYK